MALRKAKVPAELHIYQQGPHGVGLAPGNPVLFTWKERLLDWLRQNRFLAEGELVAFKGNITLNGQPVKWGQLTLVSADSRNKPVGFAMIHNGNFSITKERGVLPGEYSVVVLNLGDITHQQTLADAEMLTSDPSQIRFKIAAGEENTMTLELKTQ